MKLDTNEIHVVCVKWGDKYPSSYVNRLYGMVGRNLSLSHTFHCLTEKSAGIHEGVNILPLPDTDYEGWWIKLMLFQQDFFGLRGRIIYLDLDVVITGNIDFLAEDNAGLSIIKNWSRNRMWNSSVMSFTIGSLYQVWDEFKASSYEDLKVKYRGDQEWIYFIIPEAKMYSSTWVVSYKKSCRSRYGGWLRHIGVKLKAPSFCEAELPADARIVVFHGFPNPEDVMNGPCREWKYASFIKQYWIA